MNWIKIQETCPKAFEKWFDWEGYQKDSDFRSFYMFACELNHFSKSMVYDRDLYDFFDENGIIILITCEHDFGYEILGADRCDIIVDNIEDTIVKKWYSNRNEAEKDSFAKAFEILENKLK